MRTALGFCDDENPDERVTLAWPVLSRPTSSTTWVWELDGPAIDWTAAASAGTILDWWEENRGR